MMDKNILIKLVDVNKHYGKNNILKDINLEIKMGDRIALLGSNGSGKSTLSEIIAKIRDKSSGQITYNNNIKIGIQFQESNYPIGVTVNALISFYRNRYNFNHKGDELNRLIKIFRLENMLKKQIINLSGGQQQRLNILLALIHQPNFLILDELSTGLDIKIRRDLRDYILEYLNKHPKCGLIIVTHSMAEAELFANRVVLLDSGKIIYDLSTKEIIKEHKSLELFANKIFEQLYEESV